MKRTKVFWTEMERECVAVRLKALFRADPQLKAVSAIKEAQLVLPKDRRRPVGAQLAWRLKELVEQARREAHGGSQKELVADPGEVLFKSMILDLLAEAIAARVLKGIADANAR